MTDTDRPTRAELAADEGGPRRCRCRHNTADAELGCTCGFADWVGDNPVWEPGVHLPRGTRVELVRSTDPHTRLRPGDQGVVRRIDSVGTVHVSWDSGSTLGLLPECDEFRVVI